MQLSTRAIHTYRRSLKAWMGYAADSQWSGEFNTSLLSVLEELLQADSGFMDDFLQRYPKEQRDRRRQEVRYVVLFWLAELAL